MGDELVECYAGYAYPERPIALRWEGTRLEIAQVDAQWHSPGKKLFRVHTQDGQVFLLEYCEIEDEWSVRLLE